MTRRGDDKASGGRAPGTFRSVLMNWGGYLIAMVVSFFLSPFVIQQLGDAGYGVWSLVVAITGYLSLLELGVRGAVTRYIAKYRIQEDHAGASSVASSALAVFTVCGLLAVVVALLLAFVGLRFFTIPVEYVGPARLVLCLGGLTVAAAFLGGVPGGIVVGLQRFDVVNGIEIGATLARSAAIVVVLLLGYGIVALAVVQLVSAAVTALAFEGLRRRLYPQLRYSPAHVRRGYLKLIFSFSIYSFLLSVFFQIIISTDAIVIGAVLPVSLVTFYMVGANLFIYARGLISGITRVVMPLASNLEAGGRAGELQRVTLKGLRYTSAFMLPILATFMVRGGTFIGLWVGEEYSALSGRVLFILSLMVVFSAGPNSTLAIMVGISKHRVIALALFVEALANLGLSLWWVHTDVGIVGVAWGTTIPEALVSLLFWPWYTKAVLGIPVWSYFESSWVRPLVAVVPFTLASVAVERYWAAGNLFVFFVQVGVIYPLFVAGFWFACLDDDDRRGLAARVTTALRRRPSP